MVKSSLRVKFKSLVTQLSEEDRKAQSSQLYQTLEKYLQDQSGVWTLFCPLSDEPNLLGLLDSCSHIEWAFPRVQSQTQMEFLKVESKDQMVCSSWGLHEPDPQTSPLIPFDRIAGSIIPGMAYDVQGHQRGHYAFLHHLAPPALI
ncbi:MAG: 5-formyltetrahydrofolate cyclo-ligase, partial [Bdellovibrionales bacterium]|nr:5-formyltetrahydrofolate cyclo-ligase [Bdellovibrionales bacterium]